MKEAVDGINGKFQHLTEKLDGLTSVLTSKYNEVVNKKNNGFINMNQYKSQSTDIKSVAETLIKEMNQLETSFKDIQQGIDQTTPPRQNYERPVAHAQTVRLKPKQNMNDNNL